MTKEAISRWQKKPSQNGWRSTSRWLKKPPQDGWRSHLKMAEEAISRWNLWPGHQLLTSPVSFDLGMWQSTWSVTYDSWWNYAMVMQLCHICLTSTDLSVLPCVLLYMVQWCPCYVASPLSNSPILRLLKSGCRSHQGGWKTSLVSHFSINIHWRETTPLIWPIQPGRSRVVTQERGHWII